MLTEKEERKASSQVVLNYITKYFISITSLEAELEGNEFGGSRSVENLREKPASVSFPPTVAFSYYLPMRC